MLGWLDYALSPSYRRHLREKAQRAGITVAQRRESVGQAGKMVMENLSLWLRPPHQPIAAEVQWCGARKPITVMYRPARYRVLRELEVAARARHALGTVPATIAGVRQLLRALGRGEVVGLLPDQVPPEGLGVWAEFFGSPAYTMTLAARLAQLSGAPIVLARCEPLPLHGDDAQALLHAQASVVNRTMEQLIRQCPQQYLCGYNRYKRPRGSLRS